MDAATLQSLLNETSGSGGSSSLFDINALIAPLMPYIIMLTVVSFVITILYFVSVIQKWRANAAIIEIRDILREMRAQPRTEAPPATPPSDAEVNAT